jgi:hypothetical protein
MWARVHGGEGVWCFIVVGLIGLPNYASGLTVHFIVAALGYSIFLYFSNVHMTKVSALLALSAYVI